MVNLLSMQEAAERLGVNRSTVWRWVQRGDLVGSKVGGTWLIRESSVNKKSRERKGSQ